MGELERMLQLDSLEGCMLGINNRDLQVGCIGGFGHVLGGGPLPVPGSGECRAENGTKHHQSCGWRTAQEAAWNLESGVSWSLG